MANPNGGPSHTLFQKGNPGRQKGSRIKLAEDFFQALSADFAEHGISTLEKMRVADPSGYINVVQKLMPKEFKIDRKTDGLSDSELDTLIDAFRTAIAATGGAVGTSEDQSQPTVN